MGDVRTGDGARRRDVVPPGRTRAVVSMRDVAQLAGVSPRTVSNVVSGYVHVRAETRERVQRAIDELRYRPNLSARSLRLGRTGIIALAVPEIAAPYFAELADLPCCTSPSTTSPRRGWRSTT